MLSENLRSLRGAFARFVDTGSELSPELTVRICVILHAMEMDAVMLERNASAAPVSISDYVAPNVVPFRLRAAERGGAK